MTHDKFRAVATVEELCRDHKINLEAMEFTGTDDPVESKRLITEWMKKNGLPTHVLLWSGPNIITTTGEPTTIVVALRQPVTPCKSSETTDIISTSDDLWRRRVPAGRLGLFVHCYVPIICATNRREDEGYLVRVRKIGVTKLHVSESDRASDLSRSIVAASAWTSR